ncbi:MAG: glycoside hydrolase family 18 protein [Balneolaceae bacterium]|nr:glycoside hydrolase family 18 protein [Balneolaceae bacterium]
MNVGDSPSPEDAGYRVIGYTLGERGKAIRPSEAAKLTHINYAFANVDWEGNVVLENPEDGKRLHRLTELRAYNPDLKILLSIGGWVWSDYFSDAALTADTRSRFARTSVDLLRKYDLDGIDIDWEYPGQRGEDNIYRPEDRENFNRLLKAVREELNRQGRGDGRRYLLTIAAGANRSFLEHTDMAEAQKYLDFVNLMTYDFHGSWTPVTGHHTNLFPTGRNEQSNAAVRAVELFLEAGIPRKKLVLGVAFYGRGWTGVKAENNGLYQSYEKSLPGLSYSEIADSILDRNGFTRYWDNRAKAPYLWNSERKIFYTFDDVESLRHKTEFIRSEGLGGVMYWEHSNDPDEVLLNVLYENLLQVSKPAR